MDKTPIRKSIRFHRRLVQDGLSRDNNELVGATRYQIAEWISGASIKPSIGAQQVAPFAFELPSEVQYLILPLWQRGAPRVEQRNSNHNMLASARVWPEVCVQVCSQE